MTQRKLLPGWAIRLLIGAALLPFWLGVLDGLARVRRRRLPVAAAVRWTLASALPFALVAVFALVLGRTGLITARPGAPVPANAIPADSTAAAVVIALALVFLLGWVAVRPLALRTAHAREPLGDGHAAGALGVLVVLSLLVWLANPFAAALLVLPAHVWLMALAPEIRLRRGLVVVLGLAALIPLGLVLWSLASQLGYSPLEAGWSAVLLVAGGHVGPLAWLTWSVLGGTAVSVGVLVALRAPEERAPAPGSQVRGPRSYAGPGSLGGTDSALRR